MVDRRKPVCGSQGGEETPEILETILLIFGGIGTAASIIGAIVKAAEITTLPIIGVTVAGAGLIALSAIAAAAATFITVFAFYWDRCGSDPEGLQACSAGVINEIVESFDSASDELFPFTAMHDRVDVVVMSQYWFLVENNALSIKCASDTDSSPILQSLYESDEVCAAGLGSTIGAGVGALGGIALGILAGIAIGCATIILCVVAIIVAAIVAAAVVLGGALLGGQIGKAIAEDTQPEANGGNTLRTGDYVTTEGDLITSGTFDGARVYWFVEHTTLHGHSTGSPPFSFRDPDTNLADPNTGQSLDACPLPVIE